MLSSPEWYVLGDVCVFLLCWADCVGSLICLVYSLSGWLPGPGLCGGCWLLGGTGSQGGISAGLFLGWVKIQETLGLLPPNCGSNQVRGLVWPLAGRVRYSSLVTGPKGPRAGFASLVRGTTSWHCWVQGLGSPEACVGLPVDRTMVQLVRMCLQAEYLILCS